MSITLTPRRRPMGVLRWAFRLPIWLYQLQLGWLLGKRFLLLSHMGRKSGKLHQTVLEVVRHDPAIHHYIVAAGFGEQSDWFQNCLHHPRVRIQTAGWQGTVLAQRLSKDEGKQELLDYRRHYPRAFRELARFISGRPLQGSEADCDVLAQVIPLVAFSPEKYSVLCTF